MSRRIVIAVAAWSVFAAGSSMGILWLAGNVHENWLALAFPLLAATFGFSVLLSRWHE